MEGQIWNEGGNLPLQPKGEFGCFPISKRGIFNGLLFLILSTAGEEQLSAYSSVGEESL